MNSTDHKGKEKGKRRKEKSASEREQRQVYLNVAEREQIQDRRAGLKEKSASKREQRQVYLSVAEREQIQDRGAGLKEKEPHLNPPLKGRTFPSGYMGEAGGGISSTRTLYTRLLIY